MPKFTVDVKAFFSVPVEAENEDDARRFADIFVEEMMEATEAAQQGYNDGLPDDAIGKLTLYACPITAGIDGESDVDEDLMGDD